jgi:hypothetical protein
MIFTSTTLWEGYCKLSKRNRFIEVNMKKAVELEEEYGCGLFTSLITEILHKNFGCIRGRRFTYKEDNGNIRDQQILDIKEFVLKSLKPDVNYENTSCQQLLLQSRWRLHLSFFLKKPIGKERS